MAVLDLSAVCHQLAGDGLPLRQLTTAGAAATTREERLLLVQAARRSLWSAQRGGVDAVDACSWLLTALRDLDRAASSELRT